MREVKIPDIGDVTDAEIIEIPISVGDSLEKEDTLIVLETDKATMDVPSPVSGIVKEIKCQLGDKVSEGSLIVLMEETENTSADIKVDPVSESNTESGNKADLEPVKSAESSTESPAESSDETPSATMKKSVTEIQEIKVPDIGDNNAVEVIEISAHPGDLVAKEDPLIVLETEKASMEVPSPLDGKVIGINVVVGDKVSQGDLIGTIETVTETEVSELQTEKVAHSQQEQTENKNISQEPLPSLIKSSQAVEEHSATSAGTRTGLVHASPAIRRFARELGANLQLVRGTGPKGRILKEDVQKFVKAQLTQSPAKTEVGAGLPALPRIDFSKFGEIEEVQLSKIQKVSANNLHRNWVSIPHVTQNDEADITEMEAFRQSMKVEALSEGIKLTPLAFMMKAVVASLKAYPRFNASLASDGETLVMKKYYHIGVAVDTPDGLVVPVVRDVDQKSVYDLASELAEISQKARDKKLGIDAMQGSCFTISSLGGIGGTSFTPIVNWPDVAILGVSKSSIKPVWDGKEFQPRLMLPLSLSYDHRVIDGAVAARFVTHLSKTLTDIRRLVL